MEPLAIVGMACRVPGADDTVEFWRNLADGVDSVRFSSREEQLALGVPADELDNPNFVAAAQVVSGVADFDAGFFGMTPREAALADPQHRMFLELAHTALEDAGYDHTRYEGAVGVYAGSGLDEYRWRHVLRNSRIMATSGTTAVHLVNLPDYVATLASYKLNLRGPALTVRTACSSSLVALHLACEALRSGECDLALAGGVCVELPPGRGYTYVEGGTESPDGHCRPFDARARGTVWGSGGGVVAVKRLDDALADRDHIRALVLGNAINNDGSAKVGFSAPSADGQSVAVAQALGLAGVDPRTVSYVEAHGTGTELGDPIEVAALTKVFGNDRANGGGRCALGSVKANIGHLSQASGVAGVIKTVLALEHRQLPPTPHFTEPNPEIDFVSGPFHICTTLADWRPDDGVPRRAGVSSFGMGGTNAHVVLQEAPVRPGTPPRPLELLQISAKSADALTSAVDRLARHLDTHPGLNLTDVAGTLRLGRTEHRHRAVLVARDTADAAEGLRDRTRSHTGVVADGVRVAFLFSGQGGQHAGMGAGRYDREPVFRAAVDECAAALDGRLDLTALLFGADEELLRRTEFAQPALFAVGYALAELWRSWGVEPDAMIGHSVGEYVAATLAGVFDLPDAVRLVALRGRLMQRQPAGSMLAVRCDQEALAGLLPHAVSVAALNGPGSTVLSGPTTDVEQVAADLRAAGVESTPLRTSHAFHSAMMDPVAGPFADAVAAVEPRPPRRAYLSNLTGGWADGARVTDPAYWARHLREPVRFADCVTTLCKDGPTAMIECGPGRQLASLAAPLVPAGGPRPLPSLPGRDEERDAAEVLLGTAGRLWTLGVAPDPAALGPAGNRVPLPTYPFQRQRHWIDPDVPDEKPVSPAHAGAREVHEWFHVPSWRQAPPRLEPADPTRCLVFTAEGRADRIVAGLRDAGAEVVTVRVGDAYGRTPDGFVLRPGSREDYDALVSDLGPGLPPRIVHAWSLAGEPAGPSSAAAWQAQELGFFSLLRLTQALAAAESITPGTPVHVDAVTVGTMGISGHDVVRPEHATVAGIAKVVPLEVPGVTVRHLDTDPAAAPEETAHVVAELVRPAGGALLALRGGRGWVQEHQPAPIGAPADPTVALREAGVYVITGGLGGVGIALAEDLATRIRARLVLFDRSGLPAREEWADYLRVHGTADRTGRAIAAIGRAEAAGARMLVLAADVTRVDDLRAVRAAIMAEYGRVDGIIHAAGVPGGGMVAVKDRAEAERVLRPKLAGALALHGAFGDLTLDFVALCSSVSALVGGFGQVDYCAANNFLDAYARGEHGWDARVLAIQWSWWSEAGMAAEVTAPSAFRALEWGERTSPVDHPILTGRHAGTDGPDWCSGMVSPRTHWFLDEHRTEGVAIVPGTAHLESLRQALAATSTAPPGHVVELRDVVFAEPLPVPDDGSAEIRVRFTGDGLAEVTSVAGGVARTHARGGAGWAVPGPPRAVDLTEIRARCVRHDADELPSLFRYGPHWAGLREVWFGTDEDLGLIEAPDVVVAELDRYGLHPSLLDVATLHAQRRSHGLYLPFGYGRVLIRGALPPRLWSHLQHRDQGDGEILVVDLTLYDEHGTEVVAIKDYMLRRVDPDSVGAAIEAGVRAPAASDAASDATADAASPDARTMAGESGAGGIGSAAGADAFHRVLAVDVGPQVVVCAEPLDLVFDRIHALTTDTVEENLATGPAARAAEPVEDDGRTPVEALIARTWDDVLGTERIGLDQDFFELGGNSLVAVQLIAQVRKELGVRLPMRALFESPTVAGLAAVVERLRVSDAPPPATASTTIPRLERRPVPEAGP
ncbi:SDR family NAD(P)-dependent oxidoreductase [Actinophytocola sp.]|uniref:type I polyketide synthase n=1 Tax=Actinophytocola sp. TaxID=1872138 RepID=UPI003D6A6333